MKPTTAIRLFYTICALIGLAGLSLGTYLMATLKAIWPFSFFAVGALFLYGGAGGLIASRRWK